ncbi:MAG: hypothetical protein FWC72_00910 [Oscillospiraceae bacterium]|nr:hypothetical protein [Oscillospiraceae bacterium]
MKNLKLIITLASILLVVSAAVVAVVIFQEELLKLFRTGVDTCKQLISKKKEEYDDFADV